MDVSTSPTPDETVALLAAFEASRGRTLDMASLVRYRVFLRQYVTWLDGRHPKDIGAAELDESYFGWWWSRFQERHGREPAPNTLRNHYCALNAFYTWLERRDHVTSNPMRKLAGEAPKPQSRRNDYLSEDEDRRLLDAPNTPHERIVVYLLRFTGMRTGEALSVLQRDVDLTPSENYPYGKIIVTTSKTESGRRVIPVFPELLPELHRWYSFIDAIGVRNPSLPLLVTRNGTPMPKDFLTRVVKRVAARADVRKVECTCDSKASRHEKDCPRTMNGLRLSDVYPHVLRKTFGTALRRKGKSIDAISKVLGHSDSRTLNRVM